MNTLQSLKPAILEKYNPCFAMAYGSAVYKQLGYKDNEQLMLDLVFGVKSPTAWHDENLKKHSKEYAKFLRFFGKRLQKQKHMKRRKGFL